MILAAPFDVDALRDPLRRPIHLPIELRLSAERRDAPFVSAALDAVGFTDAAVGDRLASDAPFVSAALDAVGFTDAAVGDRLAIKAFGARRHHLAARFADHGDRQPRIVLFRAR